MEDSPALPRPFVARTLPWLLGAALLFVYLATLHPWIGVSNAGLVGQLGGWDPDRAYTEPLLWLVTRPLRLLPETAFPVAMNALAAVMAALSVALLARSVALLPHDRMREQRVRGHAENPVLHIRLAWVPVVFAASLLGLQLTFWENATLQTGEMLDLLLFAGVVAALVEYRLDLRERWLWIAALVFGAGLSNNWAMIGFAPVFLVAVIWLRGWSFFDKGFLLRMALFGLAGLACYLLLPLAAALGGSNDLGFWQTLKANFTIQKAFLSGVPRGRPLMLGLVTVLPLGLVAIRWQGTKGSSLERIAGVAAIILLQVMWFILSIYVAFDPPFSPRQLVYLDRNSGELAMLTFSFLSALAAGYFSGWFLLVGGTLPEKDWEPSSPVFRLAGRAAAGLTLAAAIAVPMALAIRNWPAVRAQNSPATQDLARALADQLPSSPALVLSDDTTVERLLAAELQRRPGSPTRVIVDTRRGSDARYRQWLATRYASVRPELKAFAEAHENVAGILTELTARWAAEGAVRYLNPSFGFFFERVWLRPNGVIFTVEPVPADFSLPAPSPGALADALAVWEQQGPRLETVARMRAQRAPDARMLAVFWSRAGNALGVDLQRGGRLEEAGRVFGQAKQVNPDNVLADLNGRVNAALKAGKVPATNLVASLSDRQLFPTINTDGPVDEPVALLTYGREMLKNLDPSPRQAYGALHRSAQLAPDNTSARLGEVEALIQGGQIAAARKLLDQVKSKMGSGPISREDTATITRLEIYYALTRQDLPAAEKLMENARGQFANDTSLLDLLTALYLRQGRLDDALPLLEQWRKQRPDDPAATLRLSTILMSRNQLDAALRMLEQFLTLKADNIPARINRAICLLRMGRLEDSRREYEALLVKMPGMPILHYGLAEVSVLQKNTNQALVHLEEYLKVAATNTTEYSEVVKKVRDWRGDH